MHVFSKLSVFIFAATTLTSVNHAQTTPTTAGEDAERDTIVLSPFVVTSSEDNGYQAKATLAGSRTRTELKDLANPLDIFTKDLVQDLAINDVQDLVKYANNVDINGVGAGNSGGSEWEIWNYNYMEIRGFKVSTATRNFMDLQTTFEAYNSDRATFSKGPNAILFGLGSPGGSLDYTTKTPMLHKNLRETTVSFDSEGTQRGNFDINHVLIDQKLAIRLNAMKEDTEYYRGPAYHKQDAINFVATWRPFEKTTLTLGHEWRDSRRASPRGSFPLNAFTYWLARGSPEVVEARRVGTAQQVRVAGSTAFVASNSLGMAVPIIKYAMVDGAFTALTNVAEVNAGGDRNGGRDIYLIRQYEPGFPLTETVSGYTQFVDSDFNLTDFNLTQQIGEDLFIDLAYGVNDKFMRQGQPQNSNAIFVNPNSGSHLGDYYADWNPQRIDREFDVSHLRLSASYDLDLLDVSRWLGKHRIATMLERHRLEEIWDTGTLVVTKTPNGLVDFTTIQNGVRNAQNLFFVRDYLDFNNGHYSHRGNRSLLYQDGISQNGYEANYMRTVAFASRNNFTETDTVMGVLQSRWLNDRLVTTFGARKDKRDAYTMANKAPVALGTINEVAPAELKPGAPAGTTDPRWGVRTYNANASNTAISRNYGAVLRITDWLYLSGNHATNIAPVPQNYNLFNELIPASTGKSTDYGVRLSLLDGKIDVSLLRYETNVTDDPLNTDGTYGGAWNRMKIIEQILFENNVVSTWPLERAGGWSTQDRVAKGEELTIVANPTKAWNLRLTAAHVTNEPSDIMPEVRAYYQENRSFWGTGSFQGLRLLNPPTGTANETVAARLITLDDTIRLVEARERALSFPSTEWVVRSTVKYKFDNGSRFQGFSVGGSGEWKSAPVVAYFQSAGGIYDITKPMRGDEVATLDLFFIYTKKLANKVTWTIQLNVKNVFDKTDPRPAMGYSVGTDPNNFQWAVERYQPVDGRIWTLTNTFRF
jgi:hypothetical protein